MASPHIVVAGIIVKDDPQLPTMQGVFYSGILRQKITPGNNAGERELVRHISVFRLAKVVCQINGAVSPLDLYQLRFDVWCADFLFTQDQVQITIRM